MQTSYPFDAGAGGNVSEAQWAPMAQSWRSTGVLPDVGTDLLVVQHASGANKSVDVGIGAAIVEGQYYDSDAVETLPIADNASGNPRIDLVVVRRSTTLNTTVLAVVQGTPAAAPAAPALAQNATVWEEPLAAVDVATGMATIVTANIRDQRQLSLDTTHRAVKEPVRVGTTAALAASTIVGLTRTANANGALAAIDGVTLVAGDRLLDKDHATQAARGLWLLLDPGSAARPWVMTRPRDFDSDDDVRDGVTVRVAEGTVNADTGWLLTTTDPIALGTTALVFAAVSGSSALTQIATATLSVDGAFDFTSIPATYKSLMLVLDSMRGSVAAAQELLYIRFDGDGAANYDYVQVAAVGAVVTASEGLASATPTVARVPGASSGVATGAGQARVIIPGYAGTTLRKQYIAESVCADAAAAGGISRTDVAGNWRQTVAINRIQIGASSGNIVAGARATLYGLN